MKFKAKTKIKAEIPQASLPDILFLLLLFFMATATFVEVRGIPILPPAARSTQKIEAKRNIAYIWADRQNRVSIDDQLVQVDNVSDIMHEKLDANRRLIISLKIDQEVRMGLVTDIQEQLREAYALRINYSTRIK